MSAATPHHHRVTVRRTHHDAARPTRRLCVASTLLGVGADDLLAPPAPEPASFALDLAPGSRTLISGDSGTGKSTLLADIVRAARAAGFAIVPLPSDPLPARAAIDQLGRDTLDAMRRLSRAGLGEGACLARRPAQLSEGQRWRLRLAIALDRAERLAASGAPALLACDEFASTLDPDTASCLARLARRTRNIRLVLATPRADLTGPLAPDTHIRCLHAGRLEIRVQPRREQTPEITIAPGSIAEYHALAPLHYRAGPPATIARILAARNRAGALIGVLTASMPTLNASWREIAWPRRYTGPCRREAIRRLNGEVRCISRVIVDPAGRATGVARRLVRAYLDDPLTPCTEALAAMGRACPFFERAGMTPYELPPTRRDARLLDALAHCGVEPWRLALPAQALRRAIEAHGEPFIERETRRWARDSGATRRRARDDLPALFALVCGAIGARPVAYAYTARNRRD